MNANEQQTIFKEKGVQTSYFGKSLDVHQTVTVIFQEPEKAYMMFLGILKQKL